MATKFPFTLDIRVFRAAFQRCPILLRQAVRQELYKMGQEIMTDSKRNYCPVDTGNLRASGRVEKPIEEGSSLIVELGYGGTAAPYALAVHENPRAGKTGGISPGGKKYKRWAQTGEWKYLETPLKAAAANFGPRMVNAVRENVTRKIMAGATPR